MQVLGVMQKGLVRNVGAVSVPEIATFGNLSSHCSLSGMNVLALALAGAGVQLVK